MSSFRILTIDGGGIRGVIPAAFLRGLEAVSGKRTAGSFDLIAGTSTGGIVALGLAAGIPAARLLEFYQSSGAKIFPPPRIQAFQGVQRVIRRLARTPYKSEALRRALEECFGDRTMGSLPHRVMIPTFDGVRGEIRLIKSSYLPDLHVDPARTLVDTAMATSAAPTYLPSHTSANGERLLDGGLWANNPIAVAVAEAVGRLGIAPESIDVLSLGTGSPPYSYPRSAARAGLLRFALGQARESVLVAQASGSEAMAKTLLGSSNRLMRINPSLTSELASLDDSDAIAELVALGQREALHHSTGVVHRFLNSAAAPLVVGRVSV